MTPPSRLGPPIVQTVAIKGAGIEDLAAALDRHCELFAPQRRPPGAATANGWTHELELRLRDRLLAGLPAPGDGALPPRSTAWWPAKPTPPAPPTSWRNRPLINISVEPVRRP